MEAFEPGTHLMLDLSDGSRIWGYLVNATDNGVYLKVTHKDAEVDLVLDDVTMDSIIGYYSSRNPVLLNAELVLHKRFGDLLADRGRKIATLVDIEVQNLLSDIDSGPQLRELASPVMMFVAAGLINTAADTEEVLAETDMWNFDQSLEEGLRRILEEGDKEEEKVDSGDEQV